MNKESIKKNIDVLYRKIYTFIEKIRYKDIKNSDINNFYYYYAICSIFLWFAGYNYFYNFLVYSFIFISLFSRYRNTYMEKQNEIIFAFLGLIIANLIR